MSIRTYSWVSKLAIASITLVLTAVTGAYRVDAAPISVPNFSFEFNAAGNGNYVPAADNWVITGTFAQAGSYNPVDGQFTGTTLGNVPNPGEGSDIHLSNLTRSVVAGSNSSVFTSAASLGTVSSGGFYELTVAAGNRIGSSSPDQYIIELLVDGLSAASTVFDGNTITDDSFQDITTSFFATGLQDGGALTIRLTNSSFAGSGTASGHFDNVRLDFTPPPIPEPSTFLLLGFGALGLMRQGRRRTGMA